IKTITATVKAKDASPATPLQLKNREVLDRLNDQVARRAYEMFERGGGADGEHVHHWLQGGAGTVKRLPENGESSSWYTVRLPLQNFAAENVSVAVESNRAIVVADKVPVAGGGESSSSGSPENSLFLVAYWPSEVDPATASAYIK